MPWKSSDVMDLRIEFVVKARQPGVTLTQVCQEFGISRACGYKWLKRVEQAGSILGIQELSRRPHTSPLRTAPEIEAMVVALRKQYGWGARKLAVVLASQGVKLPTITVHRILRRQELIGEPAGLGAAPQRFCREQPNQLWQLDFKGYYQLEAGKVYPLSLLDDHSRYLLGLWALGNKATESVKSVLQGLFREVGVPTAMLMDHGDPWWGAANGYGLSRLAVWLIRQDIELIYGGVAHPQTQGKVERLHRTLKERTRHRGEPTSLAGWQSWASEFRGEYNGLRPHEALGMAVPASVWGPVNLGAYREQPREWDYGAATVSRIDRLGCLNCQGRRFFVCEALAGERVRVDELAGRLLVTFRQMTVREINLRTASSKAVVLKSKVYTMS